MFGAPGRENSISKGMDKKAEECSRTTRPPGCEGKGKVVSTTVTLGIASLHTQSTLLSPTLDSEGGTAQHHLWQLHSIGGSQSSPGTPQAEVSGSVKSFSPPSSLSCGCSKLSQSLSSPNKYFQNAYHVPGTPPGPGNVAINKVGILAILVKLKWGTDKV